MTEPITLRSAQIASSRTTWTVIAYDTDGEVIQGRRGITTADTAAALAESMTEIPDATRITIHEMTTHHLREQP